MWSWAVLAEKVATAASYAVLHHGLNYGELHLN